MGTYAEGPLARETYSFWKGLVVALHVLVGVAALLQLGRRRLPPFVVWSTLFVGYYTAIHMLAVAYSRYRLPLMPFVFVVGALWLTEPRAPEGRARTLLVGAPLLGFVALCAHYLAVRLP